MNYSEKKYLGIDWGKKRIGLALGDSETRLASPFCVVSQASEIIDIINKEKIDYLIIGQPIKMSGAKDNLGEDFEEFLNFIKNNCDIPVELIDERLTSKAADALSGTKKTKAARDSLAAMIILQSYFDKTNGRDF
ncbi:Holliday junction resolvase RuvX [Candidatus Parcubacteria bacterium]|nr:Holliday junction resolvase RuvX [Candidatus Parcubacteria bacterium]